MPKSQNNKFRKKRNRTFKKKRMKGGNKKSKEAGTPKTKRCPTMLAKSCLKGTLKDPMCKSDACVKQMKQLPEYKEKMGNRPSTLPPSVPKNTKLETKISESKNKKLETKISESKNKKIKDIATPVVPEPVVKQPETAIVAQPEPVVKQPETAIVAQPEPVVKQPETAIVAQPEPVVKQPETAIVAQPEPVVKQPETAIVAKLYDEKKTKNACIEVDLHANKSYYISKNASGKTTILDSATNEPPPGQTVNDAVKGGDVELVYYYNPKTRKTTYDPDDPICQTENVSYEDKCKTDFCPSGHEGSWTRKCYTGSVRKHHPDRGGDAETFKRLKACHDKLSNATKEVKKAEDDVKVANETLNDAFEEKKQTELKLEDVKQQEQEAKQEILQLEDESKPEPAVVTTEPAVEPKNCETKKDCGTDFCLTPIEGGEGKCVPKDEYVSNMKARKQPKEPQEESNLAGVGQMFNEPEPAVVTTEPAVEPKNCETKKDCGTDFCLTPIEGGEGKCVPKDEYVSNMKARKQPKEPQEESNLAGVSQMFNEPEPAVVTTEPAVEPKSCETKKDCGTDFCLTPIDGGEGKCVPKDEYVSNMKARKQPKEPQEESNLAGVGQMFNEPEPAVVTTEPAVEPKSCETKKDCGTDFCLTPIDGGEGKCVPKDEYVSNMKARKQPKEPQEESNLEGVSQMFNESEPAVVTPEPAVVTPEPTVQQENVDQLKKQIEELRKKIADGCPKIPMIKRNTEDYWNEIYGIPTSAATSQTNVQDGAAKKKVSKKSRRRKNTRKRRRKNKTKKR